MALNNYSRGGSSGLERTLDGLKDDVRQLKICQSATVRVEQTLRGQVLTFIGGGAVSAAVQEYKLVSQADDYLICHSWDGETEGTEDIYIAKGPDVRMSLWNGQTVTYEKEAPLGGGTINITYTKVTSSHCIAVGGSVTEHHAVRPAYVAGRIIAAIPLKNGSVYYTDDEGRQVRITLIEKSARAFAKIA